LTSNGGRVIERLGEIDTGNPETLANFLARALATFQQGPRIAIGFWDHGSGVFDEYDPNEHILERRLRSMSRRGNRLHPARKLFVGGLKANERSMLHDDTNGGVLTNREAGRVLKVAFERAGFANRRVDLIFSDTCLNGMVEVLHEFADYAEVITASEDLEPGAGWDYQLWFEQMANQPPEDGAAWGRQAVQAFGEAYANRPFLHPCTLGAFKTSKDIAAAFKDVLQAVDAQSDAGFRWMRDAREFSQSFDTYASYDLLHFTQNLKHFATDNTVIAKADALIAAFQAAYVHAVNHGSTVPDSHGLAFWFPAGRSQLLRDVETYKHLQFDRDTGWSIYLRKHYRVE
jgi:hypothetical protein